MYSLWIVQWDFTRRDHLENPGRVSGSGLVTYTVKSSMKISITSSTKYENMDIMHLWNVVGALHKPNGILLNAKVPNGK